MLHWVYRDSNPYDLRYECPCHIERSETPGVPPRLTPQEPQPPLLSLPSAFAPLFPQEQAPPEAHPPVPPLLPLEQPDPHPPPLALLIPQEPQPPPLISFCSTGHWIMTPLSRTTSTEDFGTLIETTRPWPPGVSRNAPTDGKVCLAWT